MGETGICLRPASSFIRSVESRQGLKIACPEEIALNLGLLSKEDLLHFSEKYPVNEYSRYIRKMLLKVALQ